MLYFKNKTSIFFSLLGAMISFVLFVVFLKQNMVEQWHQMPDATKMMDLWLIGGTLSVTAITTTLSILARMVLDESRGVLKDFYLTNTSTFKIKLSYMLSAALIGFVMQLVMLALMLTYFALVDQLAVPWSRSIDLIVVALAGSFLAVAVNMIFVQFIHRVETMSAFESIVGAASGFLVGTYIPMGALPQFAQTIIKFTPGAYISALYRQIMMGTKVDAIFSGRQSETAFNQSMGIQLKWTNLLTMDQTYLVIGLIFIAGILFIFVTELVKKRQGSLTVID
ncbi:ABC-2 type transporter [Lentilactobacillus sunkii DSM 19904]|uniref:ABC-2 type transporter n=2 Tax=Lentilactobacillus sunkii TaxID=481719 RepID=A0A0R1L1Y6_9LACO|nr:ABC-2 type transporter [Lentilactobacillus sunkii DSM 19904]